MFLQNTSNQRGQTSVLEQMNKYFFFTRTKGLFRICYPRDRPPTGKYNTQHIIIILMFYYVCIKPKQCS